ncbi:MAG TPA: OB-fold domain-containing protein, partial [Candidatus Acidoferrum sp.]|nr:OB-fold domain-containing protein [Candidatus Acidoferrum sp.]
MRDESSGLPIPVPTAQSRPFWDAVARGVLMLQQCSVDGRYEWTPQTVCSGCLEDTLEWKEVSGRGTVYSYSVVTRPQIPAFEVPYTVAIVELLEGPRMLTQIVGPTRESVSIGSPVRFRPEVRGGVAL